MKIPMLAALTLGATLAVGSAFAQHTGARSPNDNGIPSGPSRQSAQPSQSSAPRQESAAPRGLYDQAPGAMAGCEQFQSYDPASGTYAGRDGMRHPCP
jgi:hypothetical protein